jgi:farnesyl-diphosphate farnesyltransferase
MNPSELGGPLLASVSRSFYLSICLLPRSLRAPIGLAYLLARASDTIADTAEAPVDTRLRHLAAFARMIRTGRMAGLAELQNEIRAPDPKENELIVRLDQCFAWLATLESKDHGEIAAVLQKIIHGQTLDLQRFGAGLEVAALQTAAELDEYTYLVAGCVGEFWTRVCLQHLPDCSHLGLADLRKLGVNYGKGLQLVNILRDLPSDLKQGRCYLPETELRAAGTSPSPIAHEPSKAQPVFDRWHAKAAEYLEDGRRYILALRSPKLRAACFLPWYLGIKTLRLMRKRSPLGADEKIKVSRSTVRFALALAGAVAFSDRALAWVRPPPPDVSTPPDESDSDPEV